MKKMFTYTFVVLMAALVFYGGAGVNIVSFCCDDCRTAGVEVLKQDMCCEIHGHAHDDMHILETAGTSCHTEERCCDLERVYFDWNDGYESVVTPAPVTFDLLISELSDISVVPLPIVRNVNTIMSTGPPICPKVYLSLLTTLLI